MKVKLINARGSFIAAFVPNAGGEKDPSKAKLKYRFTSILDKVANAADIKLVQDTITKLLNETYVANGKAVPKDFKPCLRDGEESELEGYGPKVMFIPATNQTAPAVFDQSKVQLTVEYSERIQSGYYYNVVLDLWVQDPKLNPKMDASWGRRVNATLLGIQLVKIGEKFTKAAKASADDFYEVVVDDSILD